MTSATCSDKKSFEYSIIGAIYRSEKRGSGQNSHLTLEPRPSPLRYAPFNSLHTNPHPIFEGDDSTQIGLT